MFVKKLVLVAAAVAVAMTHVAAVEEASTHIKIHVGHAAHHKEVVTLDVDETESGTGSADVDDHSWTEGSDTGSEVEDNSEVDDSSETGSEIEDPVSSGSGSEAVDDDDSAAGSVDEDRDHDDDEGDDDEGGDDHSDDEGWEHEGSPAGGHPSGGSEPSSAICSGEGESPMSVEGVEGIYCVTGQACVADIDGACPGPQEGLELGAYCGTVVTGVLGCKPNTEETLKHHKKYELAAKHRAKELEGKYFLHKYNVEHKKHASVKTHPAKPHVKVAHKKPVVVKKPVVKKVEHHKKPVVKKVEHKKPTVKKVEHKKPAVKKVEHKKPTVKKVEHHKKPAFKVVDHKKTEQKKKSSFKKVEHKEHHNKH